MQLTEELATYSWVDLCSHIIRVARNKLYYYYYYYYYYYAAHKSPFTF